MAKPMEGKVAAAKLGGMLGAAWGIIFAGCLANINSVKNAVILTVAIYLLILGIVFTAHIWYPRLKEDLIRKEEDETDP